MRIFGYQYMKGQTVDNYETLNEVMVRLFRDIMYIEQKAIITPEFKDITNNDMHVIEAIGIDKPKKYDGYCQGAFGYGRNAYHCHEQPCKKRLCRAREGKTGSPGGVYIPFGAGQARI